MRNISDTIARLSAFREHALSQVPSESRGRLRAKEDFGSNPGDLRAYTYIPENLPAQAPLVVVLHGCTQSAAGYDIGSGWSEMADRYGFALLFPEQQRQNNPNLCFNWFSPGDSRRNCGEALSIRQMIQAFESDHPIDTGRVFVTGLSAGGAMAAVMLATYPEVFAGGAIIAGLAYGCAASVPQAFDRMRGHAIPETGKLASLARGASECNGPWPSVSVWQGSADATVSACNADAILGQWGALHEVGPHPDRIENIGGHQRRVWCDADGREVMEAYSIAGMAHGTPLDTSGENGCGKSGAFMLEAGISSTDRICMFWGLADDRTRGIFAPAAGPTLSESRDLARSRSLSKAGSTGAVPIYPAPLPHPANNKQGAVRKVIEDALRAAGLMP
ncbi:alpha/beta hydrolase family esterase [Novosphingobium aerophilum]|uniref:extracellular catalytic domain type 1 short-chain-length polyhydroxyalkanoate depolymerase n=1 Tax=Novosphingobium aerophilum TaxID=2839843 RepID=UPI003FD550E8